SRSNRNAIDALPLTRPDSFASITDPDSSAPAGATVVPSISIGLASEPRTASSTLLVSEPIAVDTFTLSAVPAGIVISRDVGAGAADGLAAAAGAAAGGVDPAGCCALVCGVVAGAGAAASRADCG